MNADELKRIAVNYLSLLHEEQAAPTPEGVDEASSEWASAFLEAIRDHRERHPDSEARRSARRFGLSSARDRYRLFWEVWQNADDAKASKLSIRIRPGELIVRNNGKPFYARDVYSMCFVASSQKAGDIAQKGQFGIGFLTLMRLCDTPTVHSGPFHFQLGRDYTYPEKVEGQRWAQGTTIVAPLIERVDAGELRDELFRRLEEEVLLYMSHLRCVEVRDETTGESRKIQSSAERGRLGAQPIRLGRQRWLRYRAAVQPEPNLQREDGEPVPDGLPIILARSKSDTGPYRVASFFPTSVYHQLPWRFSAPFEVTNNREALLDSEYNRWLLARVGEVMVDAALDPSVGNQKEPWRLVPGPTTEEPELGPLYEAAHSKLREIPWIPTSEGTLSPDRVAVATSPALRRLMKPSDVADEDVSRRVWVRGVPLGDYAGLLRLLGAYFVCCHELSAVLAAGPDRDPTWYLRAAAEVIRLTEQSEWTNDSAFSNLRDGASFKDWLSRPFALSRANQDGKVVCSARSEHLARDVGRIASRHLILLHRVYRTPEKKRKDPLDDLRERVHAWLRAQTEDSGFKYEYRLDAPQFIRHFIVYVAEDDLADLEGATHDSLLAFLRDHLDAYVSAYRRDDRLAEIGKRIRVAAFSYTTTGGRVTGRSPLADAYLGKSFTDSTWADAARGVPHVWWVGAKYKKILAREGDSLGVVGFLRKLGGGEAPSPTPVPHNASHGTHTFSRVTRGDDRRYPHFPHNQIKRWYSEYGMRGDHVCPDIEACLDYLETLTKSARAERGKALLRTLERQWERLRHCAEARAYAYYSNGEYHVGTVAGRWLADLRTRRWMRFGDGTFRAPTGRFAATSDVHETLGTRDPDVCAWECKDLNSAAGLDLATTVSAEPIIDRLRDARHRAVSLSINRAAAYYAALAKGIEEEPAALESIKKEELIYLPAKKRSWWSPELSLTTDQRAIFGDDRAYLTPFRGANSLWRHLGIEEQPSLANLERLWSDLSASSPNSETESRLGRSYALANDLCRGLTATATVPVWTDEGWQQSDRVVATEDNELWTALNESTLPRWEQSNALVFAEFCRWAEITVLEDKVEYQSPREAGQSSDLDTMVFRSAVKRYAAEAARVDPNLWSRISTRVKSWLDVQVIRVDSLEVPATVELPLVGKRECLVPRRASIHEDKLYLSSLTRIDDRDVVVCLLRRVALEPSEAWNIQNGLRVKLIEGGAEGPGGEEPPFPAPADDEEEVPADVFAGEDTVERDESAEDTEGGEEAAVEPAMRAAISVDEYEVESDVTGGQSPPMGGPVKPEQADTRPPARPERRGKAPRRSPRPPTRKVEQRGLDLLIEHVLEPAGIQVSDQRLRSRVGADLFCSDHVFRELKTFSGQAPDRIGLSRHEQARALASEDRYELVVVEQVWSDPIVTIIPNPMASLRWRPTGDVEVTDWREKASSFRVIHLRRGSA